MSIALPVTPGPAEAKPAYLDWGGTLKPIFGGTLQKLSRLGDRFALDVVLPAIALNGPPSDADAELGRIWISRLIQAQRQGALFPWPQPGATTTGLGAIVVNGGGQAGSLLNLRGFAGGSTAREGLFFSIIHGGRRYLHMAAETKAPVAGAMQLAISPMLRMQPSDGAICEFVTPMIEGLLEGDSREWSLDAALFVGLSFRITEAK